MRVAVRRISLVHRVETVLVWLLGHATRIWPILVLALVVLLTSDALRRLHPREVGSALSALNPGWIAVAFGVTIANIAVMGLYDVIAFRSTRARWTERWQYGALAFAWSNFLTIGPLAGPAIRFWLYRPHVDDTTALPPAIASVALAFVSGLIAWVIAALVAPNGTGAAATTALALLALAIAFPVVALGGLLTRRVGLHTVRPNRFAAIGGMAAIGWLDWLLAAAAFVACLEAAAGRVPSIEMLRSFFLGQALGIGSLVPGGLGTSDAFWITHLPLGQTTAAAALIGYRFIYYVLPWAAASLVLLALATRPHPRRVEFARRIVSALVGLAGGLMLVSAASPALHDRLLTLKQIVPLPLVEASQMTAALAGVLLLVLARGLGRGYRAALRGTMMLLALAGVSALFKGLDWEETILMALCAAAVWSQSMLFDRPSRGTWLERRDVGIAAGALVAFVLFGGFTYRLTPDRLERWNRVGYSLESSRFLRSAGVVVLGVSCAGLLVALRAPATFVRPSSGEIERALDFHSRIGTSTTPLTIANGDKALFVDQDRGFCIYRTVGPYLAILSDPVVDGVDQRQPFIDALFRWCADLDRRPLFYQVSPDWIPPLHDRGFAFFKLGEEASVPLARITLDGHAGKMYRQVLRRGERDGFEFSIAKPCEVPSLMPELAAVSAEWLRAKNARERQFSIGFFDEAYLRRFPCALVRSRTTGQLVAFANLLRGPRKQELSVDLMRYRSNARGVMDYLFVSLFLYGKTGGYQHFNLGMAPLATVGAASGAHLRERLAHLLFQHGEGWYNFQGLRSYKEKFEPEWQPRYMAYPNAWEWPRAITHVSALIAGGWATILRERGE